MHTLELSHRYAAVALHRSIRHAHISFEVFTDTAVLARELTASDHEAQIDIRNAIAQAAAGDDIEVPSL